MTAAYKVGALGYSLSDVLPDTEYDVTVRMQMDGAFESARARTFVPAGSEHQSVTERSHDAPGSLRFSEEPRGIDRIGVWRGSRVPDESEFSYSFSVRSVGVHYEIPADLDLPEVYPTSLEGYLAPDDAIQVDHPEIQAALADIGADGGSILERLVAIHGYTEGLATRPFKGTTDALTTLRLQEASCNGKSRLFVALARATGIPARLVGGLVLQSGTKRTSHQWVEVYVGSHWVPFCPTNGYFAELPPHYLVLYHGDRSLFSHTADVNFDYEFVIRQRQVPSERSLEGFSSFNVWAMFGRLGFPFGLLRTVLMLPIGALVVVLFRNVVGVPTFGTFLPALIAAAAAETGLVWGLVAISIVMIAVAGVRLLIERFGLLHSPTLGILLAVVVMTMLGTTFIAEKAELGDLARISFFPIAVMAIASERFYLALVERGGKDAFTELGGTLLVVFACYLVMNSMAMQVLVAGFPEMLLWVIAANFFLGRWVGIRLLELYRFRTLIFGGDDG
ncbi:MAG: transglutaminase-like putative cysteine protease [Bradymonadia bacterium]|jgi:transglutaminase-like putative cysteine protease